MGYLLEKQFGFPVQLLLIHTLIDFDGGSRKWAKGGKFHDIFLQAADLIPYLISRRTKFIMYCSYIYVIIVFNSAVESINISKMN